MMAWILAKLKSLFLLAALGGPALAGYTWWDAQHIKDVETRGSEATATIEGATRVNRRRGGTGYDINLAWNDQGGQPRTAERVSVSHTFAGQIIRADKIVRNTVKIKYLADDTEAKPILIEDAGRQVQTDNELVWVGGGVGGAGLLGSLAFLVAGRRRQQSA